MLNENIKKLRKQKGYTQETLAQELNVVRQTVSKWEKGYSVPDAIMLEKIAELFEVSVSELLGQSVEEEQKHDLSQIATQLSSLDNQLARELARKKKIRKILLLILILILIPLIIAVPLCLTSYSVIKTETYTEVEITDSLDKAISKAILDNHKNNYLGECPIESHYIYGMSRKNGSVYVYLLENFYSFGFENGFFIPRSGSSGPATYIFSEDGDKYKYVSCKYAEDGEKYGDSIKKMFPSECAKHALEGLTDDEYSRMWVNTEKQAQKYLIEIKRTAKISDYSKIEHILLVDIGVSAEVDNKILDLGLPYNTSIGNYEAIEDGIRYVYQTECDGVNSVIKFIKFRFDDKGIVEYREFDALTGEEIMNPEKPHTVQYYVGKMSSEIEYTTVVCYE